MLNEIVHEILHEILHGILHEILHGDKPALFSFCSAENRAQNLWNFSRSCKMLFGSSVRATHISSYVVSIHKSVSAYLLLHTLNCCLGYNFHWETVAPSSL